MVSQKTVLKSSTTRQLKVRTICKSFLNYVRMVRLSFKFVQELCKRANMWYFISNVHSCNIFFKENMKNLIFTGKSSCILMKFAIFFRIK